MQSVLEIEWRDNLGAFEPALRELTTALRRAVRTRCAASSRCSRCDRSSTATDSGCARARARC